MLHGGITAFLAENLSSLGASVVANFARVAGIDLTVNHLLSASVGETVHAKATPLRAGKRVQVSNLTASNLMEILNCWFDPRYSCVHSCLQVWDVTFTKPVKSRNQSEPQEFATTAVARLTLLVGLPGAEVGKNGNERLMSIAKSLDEISAPTSKL